MELSKTQRGFVHGKFEDLYGAKCSIQASSLASESAIWLGVDDAQPQVMASEAAMVGVLTDKSCGWVPYPIPPQVLLSTRMHLSQEQVKMLLPALQRFAATGELKC